MVLHQTRIARYTKANIPIFRMRNGRHSDQIPKPRKTKAKAARRTGHGRFEWYIASVAHAMKRKLTKPLASKDKALRILRNQPRETFGTGLSWELMDEQRGWGATRTGGRNPHSSGNSPVHRLTRAADWENPAIG
jgi:hypothetical protein